MVRIYALMSGGLVLYVGRTVQRLADRVRAHRCKTNNTATSKDIPDWIEWGIVLLEECADDLGVAREQYYYDTLKPLYNRCRPGQTIYDWRQTEEAKAKNRDYQRAYLARKKAQPRGTPA